MTDSSSPILASVLCLRLVDFARQPVIEQARLRARLDGVVTDALQGLAAERRVVLDGTDGLVLVMPGEVGVALDVAERVAAAGLPLALGLNQGPVTLMGEAADPALGGDGIVAAVQAAGFAQPGQLLLSRSFQEALALQAPARAALLRPAGSFADAGLRSHELFAPGPLRAAQRRRRVLAAAAACAALLLAVVLGLRLPQWLAPPATLVFEITPGGDVYVDGAARGSTPPLKTLELRAGAHRIEVRHGQHPPMELDLQLEPGQKAVVRHRFAPPALLVFEVNDSTEILVDGVSKGRAPELKKLELLAGSYHIELRHPDYPPEKMTVKLDPGERSTVRHRFGATPARDKPAQLMRQLRRKLGFD